MAKNKSFDGKMVQIWTTIPESLNKQIERYCRENIIKVSEFRRAAIVKYANVMIKEGK